MSFEEVWEGLETSTGGSATGYQVRRIAPEGIRDVYLAVESPDQVRTFLMTVSPESIPPNFQPLSFRGFDLDFMEAPANLAAGKFALKVQLRADSYAEIFDSLVQDVVDCANSVKDELRSVLAVRNRIEQWQRFIEQRASEGLTPEEQRGLYGELWFLRNVMCRVIEMRDAANAWRGPMKTAQDFQYSGFAAEVKTSITNQPENVRIANERQLDDTGVSVLVLFHLSLDGRSGSGETLPEMVDELRNSARESGSTVLLEERLFEAGYLDAHEERYRETGYTLREANAFEVSENFPRIVESDLMNGIGDVSYSISLSACTQFSISGDELASLITRG